MAHGFNDNKSKANMPQVIANPSGSASDTLEKLSVDGVTYEVDSGTEVVANPSGSAAGTLEKLSVNGVTYEVESGTEVIANPSTTTSNTLEKIRIDGTNYNVGSSSSGISIFTATETRTFTMSSESSDIEKIVSFSLPNNGRTHKVINADVSATGNVWEHYMCSAPHISGSGNNFSVRTNVIMWCGVNYYLVAPHEMGYPDDSVTLTVKLTYIDVD